MARPVLVETDVESAYNGTCISVVLDIKCVTNRQRTMGVTRLTKRLVFLDFVIDAPVVTIFDGMVMREQGATIITKHANTAVFTHRTWRVGDFSRNVEACAGLAAATQGYSACGVQTVSHVEENHMFTNWLRSKGRITWGHRRQKSAAAGD